jgi:hypothetical protein
VLCTGFKRTRHPRMGAVEELLVPLRERVWNERPTAMNREKTGVYRTAVTDGDDPIRVSVRSSPTL